MSSRPLTKQQGFKVKQKTVDKTRVADKKGFSGKRTKNLMLILFVCQVLSVIVQFQFEGNFNLYLALNLPKTKTSPAFVPVSNKWIKELPTYCGKAAIRRIDKRVFEVMFCGRKMCYNEEDRELLACEEDEHNTKWAFQKIGGGHTYMLRNSGFCVTLSGGSRVTMDHCKEGTDINQLITLIPYASPPKFGVNDDESLEMKRMKFKERADVAKKLFEMESKLIQQ
jgi:hypothetical protein